MNTMEYIAGHYLTDPNKEAMYDQFQYELETSNNPVETLGDFILSVIHVYRQR